MKYYITIAIAAVLAYYIGIAKANAKGNSKSSNSSEVLDNFVKGAVQMYQDYEAKDPLIFNVSEPIKIQNPLLQLSGEIWNIHYFGLSSILKPNGLGVNSNIAGGTLNIAFLLGNQSMLGEYNFTGSVLDVIPISGVGTWSIEPSQIIIALYLHFDLIDGYINITQVSSDYTFYGPVEAQFPELLDNVSMPPDVMNEVKYEISFQLIKACATIEKEVVNYLQEIFKRITLLGILAGEIVGLSTDK